MTFGKNLKRRREQLGLTQVQLSEKAGVGQGTISSLERNPREPKVLLAVKLARALGVCVEDLLDDMVFEEEEDDGEEEQAA